MGGPSGNTVGGSSSPFARASDELRVLLDKLEGKETKTATVRSKSGTRNTKTSKSLSETAQSFLAILEEKKRKNKGSNGGGSSGPD